MKTKQERLEECVCKAQKNKRTFDDFDYEDIDKIFDTLRSVKSVSKEDLKSAIIGTINHISVNESPDKIIGHLINVHKLSEPDAKDVYQYTNNYIKVARKE